MASNKSEVAEAVTEAPATAPDVTLDEFCIRLSKSDKRVELIGAFAFTERAAGKQKDAEAAYADRFAAFATKPV